jgi:hypothetical protein
VLKKELYYREPGGCQEDDLVLVTRQETCYREMEEACCSSQVGKESPHEEEMMTIDSHERSHKKRKKDAKADGKLKMSQEDFDREMNELKEKTQYDDDVARGM